MGHEGKLIDTNDLAPCSHRLAAEHEAHVDTHRRQQRGRIAALADGSGLVSIKVMSLVWKAGPQSPPDLLMLLAIADHADDHGYAWPSVAHLAGKCRVGVRAARATIRRLERDGWLRTEIGGGRRGSVGRGISSRYWVAVDAMEAAAEGRVDKSSTRASQDAYPAAEGAYAGVDDPSTRSSATDKSSENHHEESPEEPGASRPDSLLLLDPKEGSFSGIHRPAAGGTPLGNAAGLGSLDEFVAREERRTSTAAARQAEQTARLHGREQYQQDFQLRVERIEKEGLSEAEMDEFLAGLTFL